MAKQLETTLDSFARRESPVAWAVLSAVIVVSLLILLVLAIAARNWLYTLFVLVALAAAIVVSARNLRGLQRLAARSDQKLIDWQTALPDIQRQNLNVEVFELSKILEVESTQLADLQTAYIVAEDLALRQIQHDESVLLMRHVTIGKAPFNAVFVKGDVLNCIDVSFLVVPDIRQEKVDAMLRKITSVKKTFGETGIRMKVRLMIVLVTQLTPADDDRLRDQIKDRFKNMPVGITTVVNILDFESLQKIYVTD